MGVQMPDEQQLLDLIATSNQGVLAAVTPVGYPHLTNVLYVWDSAEKMARVSHRRLGRPCVPTLGTLDNNGTVSGYIQVRCAARLLAEGFQGSDHVRFA
jgi:hypothetical protein